MATDSFTIAAVQMKIAPDRDTNLANADRAIAAAAKRGAQVVCLPELFTGYYFCQKADAALFDLAEPIPGPSEERLGKAARQNNVVVVGSLFERRMAGVYHNTATVHDATGELLGLYRKMHIPDDPLFLEKFYFTPGDLGFKVFTTPQAKVGTLVCWDQWYP
ncbi:MAG: nitrilase-related carbon-nitrogen hydrolase, partial [Gemmata sp.]